MLLYNKKARRYIAAGLGVAMVLAVVPLLVFQLFGEDQLGATGGPFVGESRAAEVATSVLASSQPPEVESIQLTAYGRARSEVRSSRPPANLADDREVYMVTLTIETDVGSLRVYVLVDASTGEFLEADPLE